MKKILSVACWRRLAQGSFLAVALQLLATGGAWAACDVTLSSILPSNQAVLKADCANVSMTSITWTRDVGTASAVPFGPFTFPATVADLFFTTLLTSGTHSYTASGNAGNVAAGKAAVVTLSQPILTVGVSPGGSVTSVPAGINGCTVAGGVNCAFGYDTGTTVVLTPAASAGNSFSSWGGDCTGSGIGNCTVSMTTLRTVTATFGAQPVTGGCGSANGVATDVSPTTNLCAANNTASSVAPPSNNTYSWTCTGANNGSTANCSAPQKVPGVCGGSNGGSGATSAPTGTQACNPGTITGMAQNAGGTSFNWTCAGPNGGQSSPQCTVGIAPTPGACNSALSGQTLATAPTAQTGCTAGSFANLTNVNGQYGWTCLGLAGGQNATCSAFQQTSSFTVATNATGSGTLTCSPNPVTAGSNTLCTATPASGWALSSFSGTTCGGSPFSNQFTTGAINSACSVTANFSSNIIFSSPPPSSSCGTGEVMGSGDRVWDLGNSGLFPVPALTGSGELGRAIQFVANSTAHPTGITLSIVDQKNPTVFKDIVISACPHSFTPAGGVARCVANRQGSTGALYLRFGTTPLNTRSYDCPLTPGGTYYINFRSSVTPRVQVWSQFHYDERYD